MSTDLPPFLHPTYHHVGKFSILFSVFFLLLFSFFSLFIGCTSYEDEAIPNAERRNKISYVNQLR